MKVYLVGGAVRDSILGLPVKERDWVVVGSNPEEMLQRGYKPVGKDFPVFLHPQTKEEYALARTERKTGPGYKGFQVHADPDVTLEDDLRRRDLTINALAQDPSGTIIDPYGGLNDLKERILRHVSPAFVEDPVRVLRVARFTAKYQPQGFRVAEETMALMTRMVVNGEVDALVPERVWQEISKALAEVVPREFFLTLRRCGALRVLLPELDGLWGVPQSPRPHPEVDSGVHTMLVLDQAVRLSGDPEVRFAALTHDLGKGLTPKTQWPNHPGHEASGARLVSKVCERLRAPKSFKDLALITAHYHLLCHRISVLKPDEVLGVLAATDAFRRPDRFEKFLLACEADFRGRTGYEDAPYPQAGQWQRVLASAQSIQVKDMLGSGTSGKRLAEIIRQRRLAAIERLC